MAYFLKWSEFAEQDLLEKEGPCHILRSRGDINLKLSPVSPTDKRI